MPSLVKDLCKLQDNALEIHLSDQIESIESLLSQNSDGGAFFDKTHITAGMKILFSEAITRLAGRSNQAVFHLKQAMGGGKTHLLLGLGYLAKDPELRKRICPEVPYSDGFGLAAVAQFNGRNNPVEYFWGSIANQLGKGDKFKQFWENGPSAPGADSWKELFDDGRSYLILIDELPPYFQYLNTKATGNLTVADIATRALANLFNAATESSKVAIVISDLSAAYQDGSALVVKALEDAKQELGRQERIITPVDMSSNEIYEILRKRLFTSLPDNETISSIADDYVACLEKAKRGGVIGQNDLLTKQEIVDTYPFHPRLKHLIALFKENEQFKQTRGLIELVSLLLRSVYGGNKDVQLIGAQHFDFSIHDVREKLASIASMSEVIAHDIWGDNNEACAQVVDSRHGSDEIGSQVASLLLTVSLSTTVNSIKGLTRPETLSCLITPSTKSEDFITVLDELKESAWYLHESEGKIYFDRQENLKKLLSEFAISAPESHIDKIIKDQLGNMFEAKTKSAYTSVAPLASLDEIGEKLRNERVLLIVNPDSRLPPEIIKKFFEELPNKNNLLVLTGQRPNLSSVEEAARNVYAAERATSRVANDPGQKIELDREKAKYKESFISTILSLFDRIYFPIADRTTLEAKLDSKMIAHAQDYSIAYSGERAIIEALSQDPMKLYQDIDKNYGELKIKAESNLWPSADVVTTKSDMRSRYMSRPGMPWVPPRGLDELVALATSKGDWEELDNNRITKRPEKKKTSCQVTRISNIADDGTYTLKVTATNAQSPTIYYSDQEGVEVTTASPRLESDNLITKALRLSFLVVDSSNKFDTGPVVRYRGEIEIRSKCVEESGSRFVEIIAPTATEIRYSLDGTEPRNGNLYEKPIEIGNNPCRLLVFASNGDIESKENFAYSEKNDPTIRIAEDQPAFFVSATRCFVNSRQDVFAIAKYLEENNGTLRDIELDASGVEVVIPNRDVSGDYLDRLINLIEEGITDRGSAGISIKFRQVNFSKGFHLKAFMDRHNFKYSQDEIKQGR